MVVFLKARTPTWGDYAFHRLGTQRTFASSCTAGYFASDSAVQLPLNVTYNSTVAPKAHCVSQIRHSTDVCQQLYCGLFRI